MELIIPLLPFIPINMARNSLLIQLHVIRNSACLPHHHTWDCKDMTHASIRSNGIWNCDDEREKTKCVINAKIGKSPRSCAAFTDSGIAARSAGPWRIGKHNIITPVMFLSLISAAAFLRLPVIPWLLPFPPYHFVDHMLTRESFLFYYPFLVIYAFCLFYFLLNLIVYLFSHYERLEKGEY